MMAATDSFRPSFQLEDKPTFHYLPNKKEVYKQNGRLKDQCTNAKGTIFTVENLLYINDGAFLCNNKKDLERLTQELHSHFLKFGLKMHVGSGNENSKTVAMVFPPTLEKTTQHTRQSRLQPNIVINEGKNFIHFVKNFKYLGAHISDMLKEGHQNIN
jgi:hypothetical protein